MAGTQQQEQMLEKERLSFDELCDLGEQLIATPGFQKLTPAGGGARFTAQQAAEWLVQAGHAQSAEAGAGLVLQLLAGNVLVPQPGGSTLAHAYELSQPGTGQPLNTQLRWQGPARSAEEVSTSLRRQLLSLYGQYVDDEGKLVDYRGMAADPAFKRYQLCAAELQRVDVSSLDREQRLAFFVNVYNSLVIHANTVLLPAGSLLGRLKFFDTISYEVGGSTLTANDIEHGLLRGNAPSPTSVGSLLGMSGVRMLAPLWFKKDDARVALAIVPPDPRIHCALNCGARSCPAIRVYNSSNIEIGLEGAMRAFVRGEVKVLPESREVLASKIFKWYGGDFAPDKQGLLRTLAKYMADEDKDALLGMLGDDGKGKVKLKFKEYDWAVNAK